MKRLAVIGQPIAHSLSPAMHNAALAALGLTGEWSYEAIELSSEEFAAGVTRLRGEGFVGANVTIPHKLAALELATEASAAAREIGAANTLTFTGDGVRADNTDAPGLVAAMEIPLKGSRALVLGAGGAARAAVWGLRREGAEVDVLNRTPGSASRLAAELDARALGPGTPPIALENYRALVNATAIGLGASEASAASQLADLKTLGLPVDELGDHLVVADLAYGDEPTALGRLARSHGARFVDGLEVLVRQGAESFRIWTGREPPLETMRQAVRGQRR
jgi:shikimate dehydrogenase